MEKAGEMVQWVRGVLCEQSVWGQTPVHIEKPRMAAWAWNPSAGGGGKDETGSP